MESKPASASHVQMTELVLPSHTNALNSVFGGVIMSWIDIAAAISAQRHSNRPVVTASIDALNFVAPAYVGWVITLKASVNAVHKTSMEVGVRVDGESPLERRLHHIATAYTTFVALENGKPTKVCDLIPETDEEKRRAEEALKRRALRLEARKI